MIKIKYILIFISFIISFGVVGQKKSDQLKLQEKKLISKIANTELLIKETIGVETKPFAILTNTPFDAKTFADPNQHDIIGVNRATISHILSRRY